MSKIRCKILEDVCYYLDNNYKPSQLTIPKALFRSERLCCDCVKKEPMFFYKLPIKMQTNENLALKFINDLVFASNFKFLFDKFADNERVMLAAIKQDSDAFDYADKQLQTSRKFILSAMAVNGSALKKVSEKDRDDKEIVLVAVKENGYALQYASERLSDDKEIVLVAVKENGYALQYASERLSDDKEVVLAAVKQIGDALMYASERLQDDKEIVLAAVKQDGCALECASKRLQDDKEVVLAAVKQDGFALTYASKRLKDDKEVVIAAVKCDYNTLKYASERLREDPEVIVELLKGNKDKLASYEKMEYLKILRNCEINGQLISKLVLEANIPYRTIEKEFGIKDHTTLSLIVEYAKDNNTTMVEEIIRESDLFAWHEDFLPSRCKSIVEKIANSKDLQIIANLSTHPERFCELSTTIFKQNNRRFLSVATDAVKEAIYNFTQNKKVITEEDKKMVNNLVLMVNKKIKTEKQKIANEEQRKKEEENRKRMASKEYFLETIKNQFNEIEKEI